MARSPRGPHRSATGIILATCVGCCCVGAAKDCPTPSRGLVSHAGGKAKCVLENHTPEDLALYWIDYGGRRHLQGIFHSHEVIQQDTFRGHVLVFHRMEGEKELVFELVVDSCLKPIVIRSCGAVLDVQRRLAESGMLINGGRAEEFDGLKHRATPCQPVSQSQKWSCVRFLSKSDVEKRRPELYGFATKEEAQDREVGATFDFSYTGHIPDMIRVARGPGYLKMSFTERLKSLLLPWFSENVKTSISFEDPITGGYTNHHIFPTEQVNLDEFPAVRLALIREMRDVLQWWTQQELKHTSTFGARIYRRHTMLLNHVDRRDSHLASAVLQVHQEVDEDAGWPLEIIDEDGNCHEVYLQPGEMVLYEGGKFQHGRPMRLRGNMFANIFTHFAPIDWHGPYTTGGEEL
mmetsp:Transcript_50906/g.142458  ORF Transcript_50906/g.142458 Transcript_50906/m.142458 type:complete len:406 (+) Transcript_50906:162-1379(+)